MGFGPVGPSGPVRTCVGCRSRRRKDDLVRVVRGPDGEVHVDGGRGAPGRGAYVCLRETCATEALTSGRLGRALRATGSLPEGLLAELLGAIGDRAATIERGNDGETQGP